MVELVCWFCLRVVLAKGDVAKGDVAKGDGFIFERPVLLNAGK